MWQSLGFKNNPYDFNPLRPQMEDTELLVGRESESIELYTTLETSEQGVMVISGTPGVGKTSFFNVNQYLLENNLAPFGPNLLAARRLCPIQPGDTPRDVALRAVYTLTRSVQEFCNLSSRAVPTETNKVINWLNSISGGGFNFGFQILGNGLNYGREITVPPVSDISFEGLQDVIHCIVSEVKATLGFVGVFIALDNTENLDDEQLGSLLITFRDTLFSIPSVWWVLIGQTGLASLIQTLDPRVSERLTGSGLELTALSLDELEAAIAKRVTQFHVDGVGKSPLPTVVHKHLYDASNGEIRFVFKYGSTVCLEVIKDVRVIALNSSTGKALAKSDTYKKALDEAIGRMYVQQQISEILAMHKLQEIVQTDINGLSLKPKEKEVLNAIGKIGGARAKDFKAFGFKSMQDFSSNYLSKLYRQHLLFREQEGRAVLYKLRGIAIMGMQFDMLR